MCGIVGYIGPRNSTEILLSGLKRMEYRGYDSAGISINKNDRIDTIKKKGKVSELESLIDINDFSSEIGIAHTRWATHGFPNDQNAHPHIDNSGNISVVHNGIIENYNYLKMKLIEDGYTFYSETDTEVLAVLIGAFYEKLNDLEKAVRYALSEVDGTFGIIVMSTYEPDKLISARRGSPLLLGVGKNEFVIASDAAAIIQYTNQVIYLSDNEMAVVDRNNFTTKTIQNEKTRSKIEEIELF
jgi:glucosamine--fructose-6-phosphate aminotransferase (isomerizing)